MRQRVLGGVLVLGLAVALASAQPAAGVHPVSGRRFAQVMGYEGAAWLERSDRETEEMPSLALKTLAIPQGATVADIGAGSGYFTTRILDIVGPTGRVYAVDIQPEMLDLLRRRVGPRRLPNVTLVLGSESDPKLPDTSIDLAILVDVYHELSQPQAMLRHIRESLKPGGRLVLLEYRKEDPSVPIKLEHKMTVAEAKMEVEAEGFRLARVNEDLPRQHILMFIRP